MKNLVDISKYIARKNLSESEGAIEESIAEINEAKRILLTVSYEKLNEKEKEEFKELVGTILRFDTMQQPLFEKIFEFETKRASGEMTAEELGDLSINLLRELLFGAKGGS